MLQHKFHLYQTLIGELLRKIKLGFPNYSYVHSRHMVTFADEHNESIGFVRLPLHLELLEDASIINEKAIVLYIKSPYISLNPTISIWMLLSGSLGPLYSFTMGHFRKG